MSNLIKRRIPTVPITEVPKKEEPKKEELRPIFLEPIFVPKVVKNPCVLVEQPQLVIAHQTSLLPVALPGQPYYGYVHVNNPVLCIVTPPKVEVLPRIVPGLIRF